MIRRLFALLLALLLVFSTCALSEGEETPAIAAESLACTAALRLSQTI